MLSQIVGIFLDNSIASSAELSELVSGKTITYSFDAKADSNIDLSYGKSGNTKSSSLTNEWQRFYITFNNAENCTIFFYNKSATVATFYIRNIKLIFGEGDTSYSPYGQGSVEVKKINKNFYKLDIEGVSRSGVDYTTRNGTVTAKRTATAESGSYFNTNRTKLPAGTYVISGVDDTFVYANARIEVYTSDTIDGNATQITTLMNTRLSYKYTSDKPFYLSFSFVVTGKTDVNDTFIFKPQAEKNVATDFEKHEEQSYILDIQKPMLLGDYFDLERGKEVHKWIERELTGTENITLTDTVNGIAQFTFSQFYDGDYDTGSVNINALSNCYKGVPYQSSWLKDNSIALVGGHTARIMTSEYSTVEEFKQMLAGKYAEGNPVRIYYKLIKPKELDLTEEQKAVLQQLSELELFAGTNNIITAESLALMQMQYIADTETYIDNRIDEKLANINQQILEIAGGK